MDLSYIGENIKNRRKELGLTQTDITKSTGISSGNMSDLENSKKIPSCQTLMSLSNVLQCSIDYLVMGETRTSENYVSAQLTDEELELLESFNTLSRTDKDEVIEYVQFKEFKSSRKGKRESEGTEKSFHSDHDSNSSNGYGIA